MSDGHHIGNTSRGGLLALIADGAIEKARRMTALAGACRVLAERAAGTGDHEADRPADPANVFVRLAADTFPRGSAGSWAMALPVAGELPLLELHYDDNETRYQTGGRRLARVQDADFLPLPDEVSGARLPAWMEWNYGGQIPRDADGIQLATTKHPDASSGGEVTTVKAPLGGPLVADQAGQGKYGAHMFEMKDDGSLDRDRSAPLQTGFWIKLLPPKAGQSATRGLLPAVAAVNHTAAGGVSGFEAPTGHNPGFGYAPIAGHVDATAPQPQQQVAGSPGLTGAVDTGAVPPFVTPPGAKPPKARFDLPPVVRGRDGAWRRVSNDPGRVIVPVNAFLSDVLGGPITVGHAQSIHRLGVNDDNEAWNPAGVNCNALFTLPIPGNEERDGPLDFEQQNEPDEMTDGGTPVRVHLQWGPTAKHVLAHQGYRKGGSLSELIDGRWRWHVRIPVTKREGTPGKAPADPSKPPPDDPPPGPPGGPPSGAPIADVPPGTAKPPEVWFGGTDGSHSSGPGFILYPTPADGAETWEHMAAPAVVRATVLGKVRNGDREGRDFHFTRLPHTPLSNLGVNRHFIQHAAKAIRAGTASGAFVVAPPEIAIDRDEAHWESAAAIDTEISSGARRVSEPVQIMHRTGLGFGDVGNDNASVVGWQQALDRNTGNFALDYLDSEGEADFGKLVLVQGVFNGANVRHNWEATTNPGASNDETQGYRPTSVWVNTSAGTTWTCVDAAEGAAVWFRVANHTDVTTVAGALADHLADTDNPHLTNFLKLTDTPSAFTGQALKVLRVNAGETGLEYSAAGSGTVVTIVPGANIDVDATDPANPVASLIAVPRTEAIELFGGSEPYMHRVGIDPNSAYVALQTLQAPDGTVGPMIHRAGGPWGVGYKERWMPIPRDNLFPTTQSQSLHAENIWHVEALGASGGLSFDAAVREGGGIEMTATVGGAEGDGYWVHLQPSVQGDDSSLIAWSMYGGFQLLYEEGYPGGVHRMGLMDDEIGTSGYYIRVNPSTGNLEAVASDGGMETVETLEAIDTDVHRWWWSRPTPGGGVQLLWGRSTVYDFSEIDDDAMLAPGFSQVTDGVDHTTIDILATALEGYHLGD